MTNYRRASLKATAVGLLIIAATCGLMLLVIVPSDVAWIAAGACAIFLPQRALSYWAGP